MNWGVFVNSTYSSWRFRILTSYYSVNEYVAYLAIIHETCNFESFKVCSMEFFCFDNALYELNCCILWMLLGQWSHLVTFYQVYYVHHSTFTVVIPMKQHWREATIIHLTSLILSLIHEDSATWQVWRCLLPIWISMHLQWLSFHCCFNN